VKKVGILAKVFSPAKINLFFATTGRRLDGHHDVFSANCAVAWGDNLQIRERRCAPDEISCSSSFADEKNNSIAMALNAFRQRIGQKKYFSVALEKNIPVEAGFGGGSSNAAAALRGVNWLSGNILSFDDLMKLCHGIGADCPFFLDGRPSMATGIGNVLAPMDGQMVAALQNYSLLIFKPGFGVSTKVAYATLRENFQHLYVGQDEARHRFTCLREAVVAGRKELPLFNTFSDMFFLRHKNLLSLCRRLKEIGANAMLTGSGSGFFCLIHRSLAIDAAEQVIRQELGEHAFIHNPELLLRKPCEVEAQE
jgi:4-diphosphocytidyl-2-C-methyl-D-erythritol kinase